MTWRRLCRGCANPAVLGLAQDAVRSRPISAQTNWSLDQLAHSLRRTMKRCAEAPCSWTNSSGQKSGDADAPSDLSVALPVGVFARNPGIVRRRLDMPVSVNGSRGDGVLAR